MGSAEGGTKELFTERTCTHRASVGQDIGQFPRDQR